MQDFFFIHKYTPFYIYSGVAAPCNTRIGEQRGKVNSCQTRMRQYRVTVQGLAGLEKTDGVD